MFEYNTTSQLKVLEFTYFLFRNSSTYLFLNVIFFIFCDSWMNIRGIVYKGNP